MFMGLALKSEDSQSIYYFGGIRERSIHRFDPVTKVTVKLSTVLPSNLRFAAGVTTLQSAFIFDAHGREVLEFDLEAETVKIIGELSFGDEFVRGTVSVKDITSNSVWIFGITRTGLAVNIFNTASKLTSNPNIYISVPLDVIPAVVSAGRYGYLFGVHRSVRDSSESTFSSYNILR
jgi:hypothetical protein